MFKKIILALLFVGFGFGASLNAQSVFNDTILFDIRIIKTTANNNFRYLMEFQTVEAAGVQPKTGQIMLNMCSCYCDSIWDAWPSEANGSMIGGTATLDYVSSSNSGGGLGSGLPLRQRGRLNIWQMPGSFSLSSAFSLPVILRFDP